MKLIIKPKYIAWYMYHATMACVHTANICLMINKLFLPDINIWGFLGFGIAIAALSFFAILEMKLLYKGYENSH